MKKLFAVYTQYEPTYKYEEDIVSIWENREDAILEAEQLAKLEINDYVWVQPVAINSNYLFNPSMDTEKGDHVIIKPKVKDDKK